MCNDYIVNKFNLIKDFKDKNNYLSNIILYGNNSYINTKYLDRLTMILFGDKKLKKIDGPIVLYSCKYYTKFTACAISNDKLIDSINDFVQCRHINNCQKVFIIYNLNNFNKYNISYIKNIIEKYKIIILATSNVYYNNLPFYSMKINSNQYKEKDKIKYNIYYNILDTFYKKINKNNFISYTDQLTKQLNKYLYDFTYFIKICFDYFIVICIDKPKLIKKIADAEHIIKINRTKNILLNKLLLEILEMVEDEKSLKKIL